MDLHLHFILVNSEFNQALADELFQGHESEENIKFLWEDELKVGDVDEFKIKNNVTYTLAGSFADAKPFSFEVPDMTICDCSNLKGEKMQFAVSKKALKKTEKVVDEKNNETHIYFYLSDTHTLENPMEGVYILKKDFPRELIR